MKKYINNLIIHPNLLYIIYGEKNILVTIQLTLTVAQALIVKYHSQVLTDTRIR